MRKPDNITYWLEDKPPLQFLHVPDSLTSLAALYGIADLF